MVTLEDRVYIVLFTRIIFSQRICFLDNVYLDNKILEYLVLYISKCLGTLTKRNVGLAVVAESLYYCNGVGKIGRMVRVERE